MKTIKAYTKHSIFIKKSEFVAHLIPCSHIDDAQEMLKSYSDFTATHNCYAYIIGQHEKAVDDGEPSQTAGMPMLNVLRMNGIDHVIALVTRYFGGIKLGAGGLTRAYTQAVVEALNEAEVIESELVDLYKIWVDYSYTRQVEHFIKQNNILCIDQEYNENVSYLCYLRNDSLLSYLQDLTRNQYRYELIRQDYIEKQD